jgi:hypothetical protein
MKKRKTIPKKSIIEKAEEALKKAVQKTIADHKRTGDPIAIWRDGKAVFVDPEELEIREPKAEYKISGKRKR